MKQKETELWKLKLLILLLVLVPSFTNFFSNQITSQILPGLSLWQLAYFFVVFFVVLIVSGRTVLISSITIVSLLSISVVFIGAFIACLRIVPKFSNDEIFRYSQHYVRILITMLTVVPMAIAVISALPFRKYELLLLNRMRGVSMCERILLMGTRVSNHVCLTIIPNVILVRREERLRGIQLPIDEVLDDAILEKGKKFKQKVIRASLEMINITLASICLSLEYIPLWALEISNLPSKKTLKEQKKEKQNGETKTSPSSN